MANIVVSALATFNGKALKKGAKEISVFDKQAKKLGRTFVGVFGASALFAFSKKAVKAFAADEKAAKSLEIQLKNTGFAFSAPAVEQYIGNLQRLYGVLDDELRPAFQQLLTATGSITRSQDALQTALNVSAATGRSLTEVSAALTRGFSGNTAGLSRLGAGISKATLKTGDMDKIMGELNAKFAGQAAARLGTYAGKMSLLQVASADATEIIGKGLVDALSALGDNNSITDLTTQMTNLAEGIADVARGLGVLASGFIALRNAPGLKELIDVSTFTNIFNMTGKLGAISKPPAILPPNQQRSAGRVTGQQLKVETKIARARAEELRLLGLKNGIENKNVEELKKKFDLERIGLTAALNSATDEETKLRLKAQLAILDNNEAMAKKLLAEMEAAEALKKLAEQARLAGLSLEDFGIMKIKTLSNKIDTYIEDMAITVIKDLNARIAAMLAKFPVAMPAAATAAPSSPLSSFTVPQAIEKVKDTNARIQDFLSGFPGFSVQKSSSQQSMDIRVTVDTSAGGDKLSQAIAESIQVATRSGYSTVPAGFLV